MDGCPGKISDESQQSNCFRSISSGSLDKDNKSNIISVTAYTARGEDEPVQISFTGGMEYIGEGGSGKVYKTQLCDTNEIVAVKKLKKRLNVLPLNETNCDNAKVCAKNMVKLSKEWNILKELEHCNIVKLKWFFLHDSGKHLRFVLEYMPQSLRDLIEHYNCERGELMNISLIKVFMYQLFRGLAYIHSLGIAHRSIKPANILVDSNSGVLKLCDFGNSKYLLSGECHHSRVCSLAYRAPELVLNFNVRVCKYTTKIDLWSAGCILSELLLGRQLFNWTYSEFNHFCKIFKILGIPTKEEIIEINPESSTSFYNSEKLELSEIKAYPDWTVLSSSATSPEAIDLVSRLLVYSPSTRISPLSACTHNFFDELRTPNSRLPNGFNLPPLFNFTEHELNIEPKLNSILSPLQ